MGAYDFANWPSFRWGEMSTRITRTASVQFRRLARLVQGQCPIHGIQMVQAHTDWPLRQNLLCCPTADCPITAAGFSDGTFELSHEFCYLLVQQQ